MESFSFTNKPTYFKHEGDNGDTQYRKEFLEFTQQTIYDDDVVSKILDTLYLEIKEEDFFKKIVIAIKQSNIYSGLFAVMDDSSCLMVLFSYDFFHLFFNILHEFKTLADVNEKTLEACINAIEVANP